MRRAVVLADGDAPARADLDRAWPGWDRDIDLVVAADGGARAAAALGLHLDRWVGDGDSLGADELEALRQAGVEVRFVPTDKDESDTELAVTVALDAGASDVAILGALGGPRLDHLLANVTLLAHPRRGTATVTIVDPTARVRVVDGPATLELAGRAGDTVTLLALRDAAGVRTSGLRYPLDGEALAAGVTRGLSNERVAAVASVEFETGRLLVVEVPATLGA